MSDAFPLVIVGTGLAGYNLAKEFRKLDSSRPLLLITADDGRFYSKPLLSTGFAKGKEADELAMQDAAAMAAQLDAEILVHTRVDAIDPATRSLTVGQRRVQYSDLVLATGALARELPGAQALGEHLLSINDLTDYARFRRALLGKRSVAIVGAGLIGSEFANDLAAAGFEVQVVAPDRTLMAGLIPAQVAEPVRASLESLGVRFHLGQGIRQMDSTDRGVCITLEEGTRVEAEQVLSAIGLVPNRGLAEAAGLDVAKGISVDRQLRSSAEHIYALGDCAEVASLSLMYVMPLMTCARALAKTLTGTPTEISYSAMPIMVKTPACPLVVSPPLTATEGEWTVTGDGPDQRALFHDAQGVLHGYALTGAAVMEKLQLNRQLPGWLV
ncbi:FAD-dependent oxidoreductase [Pseudomonas sp. gcc21]|uniref:NAD(P)/FAD-dependent oxidoreductase n=1 Tax=Pseudomonas sp. gcc21 TaxID=2726989 RepID=UPI0014526830|nr:FAD-dependent oxidoreductase [Pseudomonas sp. gcc21]QJD59668.1 FAD-dependent oxidoreductase [Pseudomonas sp. gcc21]